MEEKTGGMDYVAIAEVTEEFREAMNALVMGLVADGFTDREARGLVAGFWAARIDKKGAHDEHD